MTHPKVLAALMALDEGSRTQKVLGDDFIFIEILRETLRNTTYENAREVDTETPKVLVEYMVNQKCSAFHSGAVEISRGYLLIRTDNSQKTVVGCP